jgi:hypothetical protein
VPDRLRLRQRDIGAARCLVTRTNRQPAVAFYVPTPGEDHFAPLAIDVLRIADRQIAGIVTFARQLVRALRAARDGVILGGQPNADSQALVRAGPLDGQ